MDSDERTAVQSQVLTEPTRNQEQSTRPTNRDIQAGTTRTSDNRSAVQSHVHDNYHQVDPRQLHANANSSTSRRNTAPIVNLPPVVPPIFYDLHQKNLHYDKFRCRFIHPSDLANVAGNYAYFLFGIVQLRYYKGKNGTVCNYQCKWCELPIRFKRKFNVLDDFFILDTVTFPCHLLNQSSGNPSPPSRTL